MSNRRDFIKKAALLSGATGIANTIPASIQKALAINPAPGSTYLDAEHVVFLMQENRSFDHTFGTLRGVRGFNDPRIIRQPNGNLAWLQTDEKGDTYAPYRLNIKDTKATWMSSLPHGWSDQVDARNKGKYDGWLLHKKSPIKSYEHLPLTMGYYDRNDLPFYYALADAFTVCDHNFCSSLTGTTPNRLYFWTGSIRAKQQPDSRANVWNSDVDYNAWADWKTFPEVLEDHGVSWKVYQNEISVGVGLDDEEENWLANFTDNPLEWFENFNVRFSKAHREYLPVAKTNLEIAIANMEREISEGKDSPDLQRKLAARRKQLSMVEDSIKNFTQAAYDKLSERQKALHGKAFTTNVGDPDYHELTTLKYKDGNEDRSIRVPKGDVLHQFREDVKNGQLPTVSWLVPPAAYSDHPGSPWYGAWFLSETIDILTQDPEIWKKTIFVLTYDENDGYYDHFSPFVAHNPADPSSGAATKGVDTSSEFVTMEQELANKRSKKYARESPIGLGYRVPMVIASPWSRGGKVCSQVFDHTSSLQFLEHFLTHKTRKTVECPNITSWRRVICGDLSSVFKPFDPADAHNLPFLGKDAVIEQIYNAKFKELPDGQRKLNGEQIAAVNASPHQSPYLPRQEAGTRTACAIPYELYLDAAPLQNGTLKVKMKAGKDVFSKRSLGAPFSVYAPGKYKNESCKLWSFSVEAGESLEYDWNVNDFEGSNYWLYALGPNGFSRELKGNANDPSLITNLSYQQRKIRKAGLTGNLILELRLPANSQPLVVNLVDNAYKSPATSKTVHPGVPVKIVINLEKSSGWYDFTLKVDRNDGYERRYTGHVETGADSISDPFMGAVIG